MKRVSVLFAIQLIIFTCVFSYGQSQWIQFGNCILGDTVNNKCGSSVSMSYDGSVVAVGYPNFNAPLSYAGLARVYMDSAGSWIQKGADILDGHYHDQSGTSISLNADGSVVAVGAPKHDGASDFELGIVRVYQFVSGTWVRKGDDIIGENNWDELGTSISLSASGNILAIGAPYHSGSFVEAGYVQVYEYISGQWVQMGDDIDGEAANDKSGESVSLNADGTVLAIGASHNSGNGAYSGQVRVWKYSGGMWNQLGSTIYGDTAICLFGRSVCLSADGLRFASGEYGFNGDGNNVGRARVFEYDGSDWIQIGNSIDGQLDNDRAGSVVRLSPDGNILSVFYQPEGIPTWGGMVKTFIWAADKWTQFGGTLCGDSDDYFGSAMALNYNGSRMAVGAPLNDSIHGDAGYVKVLDVCLPEYFVDNVNACNEFEWINGKTYLADNYSAMMSLLSSGGCDSLVFLHLTIDSLDVSVVQNGSTLTATAAGLSYQWLDCSNEFQIVPGETGQVFTTVSDGTYACEIKSPTCTDTSHCVEINSAGMNESGEITRFTIFPNPTTADFGIDFSEKQALVQISMVDALGRVVFNKTFSDTNHAEVNFVAPSGIYIIKIISGKSVRSGLIIVKE